MRAANTIARLVEDALRRYPVPASQIVNQVAGSQIAPATSTTPGAITSADYGKLGDYPDVSSLTPGAVLRATAADVIAFGAVDLADSDAVTGLLAPANGGTGVNNGSNALTVPATGTAALGTGAATRIAYWSGTNTLAGLSVLTYATGKLTLSNTPFQSTTSSDGLNAGMQFADNSPGQARALTFDYYNGSGSLIGQFAYVNNSTGASQYFRVYVNGAERQRWTGAGAAWIGKTGGSTTAGSLDVFSHINTDDHYRVDATQVISNRRTGWSAMTGTAARTAAATHTAQTISNPPTQAQVQSIDNSLVIVSQRLKALLDDLIAHGLIGA